MLQQPAAPVPAHEPAHPLLKPPPPPERLLTLAFLALACLLCLLPMLRLAGVALSGWLQAGDGAAAQVLTQRATWLALQHSIVTSAGGMLVSLLLGGGFALLVTLTDIRARPLWVFGLMLPMMIPPQVTALAWLQMTGPSSALLQAIGMAPPLGSAQPLYSATGIALLLGVQHAALVYLTVRASLLAIPCELIEAAQQAGATRSRVLVDIIWPLARRGLQAAALLAFVSGLGNFGIPALLGIPVGYYVLPTLIYQKMAASGPAMLAQVATLAMLTGALALLAVWLHQRLLRAPGHRLLGHSGQPLQWPLGAWHWPAVLVAATVLTVIVLAPLLALLCASLVPALGVRLDLQSISLAAYHEMLGSQGVTWRAARNSFALSLAAALLLVAWSLPLAWLMARRPSRLLRALEALLELPYAVPGVVLAVACILAFARPVPGLDWGLYGSLWLIFIAYLARFWMIALRPLRSAVHDLDPAIEEAARLAGAGLVRRMADILAPLLAPAGLAAGLMVFLTALNELTVSALLWSGGSETLGVMIFNFHESGESVLASAISVLIVCFVALAMLSLSWLGRGLPRGAIPWRN